MIPTLFRKLRDFSRLLIVRVILIAGLAVIAIALARASVFFLPDGLDGLIGAEAVDALLSIIANSMLTVTTFSLTVMAATHRYVSGTWTPRSHQILLQDTVTHTVLATFVGAYIFSLIAITLRETEVFRGPGLVVLFGMTIVVLLLIVIAIIRWIRHLEMFGSLIETARRIEEKTAEAWRLRNAWPGLGCNLMDGEAPEHARALRARTSGYVQQIYQDRLQEAVAKAGGELWMVVPVGDFVHRGSVMARTSAPEDEKLDDRIHENIQLGSLRNFTQDPEFGLLCLSEIASRALSPGINDPGTAIDVLRRMGRILMGSRDDEGGKVIHDRLYVPVLDRDRMLRRTFRPIARDGASFFEVQAAFDQTMAALCTHPDARVADTARSLRDEVQAAWEENLGPADRKLLPRV